MVLRHFLTYAVIEYCKPLTENILDLSPPVARECQSRLVGFRLAYVLAVGLRLPHDMRQPLLRNQAGAKVGYTIRLQGSIRVTK